LALALAEERIACLEQVFVITRIRIDDLYDSAEP
jgi:hypothetical protein